jgi:hypothetical protein
MDRPSPQCHLWLFAGTVVEGRTLARITRVAPYCVTRCGHTCPTSPAPNCGEYTGAATYADWYTLARREVVSYSVLPFCAESSAAA